MVKLNDIEAIITGSRMMHLAIGTLLQRRYQLSDAFLLGSIAPDVQKNMGVPKDTSHFIDRDEQGYGSLNLGRFRQTYVSVWRDPFVQGYYCHLIADDIWIRGEFNQSLRHFAPTDMQRNQIIERHYQDFHSLNAILKNEYDLVLPKFTMPGSCPIVEIDPSFLPDLLIDLKADFSDIEHTLMIHTNEQIKAYIEAAVAEYECVKLLCG